MKCPYDTCEGSVDIVHTYTIPRVGRTSDGVCLVCKRKVVTVTEFSRGSESAYRLAKKMKQDAEKKQEGSSL